MQKMQNTILSEVLHFEEKPENKANTSQKNLTPSMTTLFVATFTVLQLINVTLKFIIYLFLVTQIT